MLYCSSNGVDGRGIVQSSREDTEAALAEVEQQLQASRSAHQATSRQLLQMDRAYLLVNEQLQVRARQSLSQPSAFQDELTLRRRPHEGEQTGSCKAMHASSALSSSCCVHCAVK